MLKHSLVTSGLVLVALWSGAAAAERLPDAKLQIVPPTPEWQAAVEEAAPAQADDPGRPSESCWSSRVSRVSTTRSFRTSIACSRSSARSPGAFDTTVSVQIEALTPESLAACDVLVLNNNCSKGPRRNLFLDVLETDAKYQESDGGGARNEGQGVGAVAAGFRRRGKGARRDPRRSDHVEQLAKFTEMVGGAFYYHPPNQEVTIRTVDPRHPLVAAFQGKEPFIHRDEPYCFNGPYEKLNFRPLLSMETQGLRDPKGEAGKMARYVAWIKPYGKGRVFYCSPSHFPESYTSPTLLRFLLDGTQYAAGDLKCDDSPMTPRRP